MFLSGFSGLMMLAPNPSVDCTRPWMGSLSYALVLMIRSKFMTLYRRTKRSDAGSGEIMLNFKSASLLVRGACRRPEL